MNINQFWWPLDLTQHEEMAVDQFTKKILAEKPAVDNELNHQVLEKLDRLMKINVADIIERDGLPHHCHLINGWGNSKFNSQGLIHGMEQFAHCNVDGQYFILQCNPEGDFHPWQSFAYAVMAGVDPNMVLSSRGFTLASLAHNSREINNDKGIELGHLLFAIAYLEPSLNVPPFYLKGKEYNVEQLMDLAIEAHHYGTFDVCRKFHLTEGLCAASVNIPGLEKYKEAAQGFLTGQLDMLLVLGVILQEARILEQTKAPISDDSLITRLRVALRFGHLIENHVYYAGHLIELAGFALSLGYTLKLEHMYAMHYIINELNLTIPLHLPFVSFQEHFYAFGHYRRAVTLLQTAEQCKKINRHLTRQDLNSFIVDFDALPLIENEFNSSNKHMSVKEGGVYDISIVSRKPRQKFISTIEQYSHSVSNDLKPRGKFEHFRRIGPPTWPRSFHYELLDYGESIGAEIHIESESVLKMKPIVENLTSKVKALFPMHEVEWDPEWHHGFGRLRVIFEECYSSQDIAEGLQKLIKGTYDDLDTFASSLEVNALNRSNLAA